MALIFGWMNCTLLSCDAPLLLPISNTRHVIGFPTGCAEETVAKMALATQQTSAKAKEGALTGHALQATGNAASVRLQIIPD